MKKSYVYKITCKITGEFYFGSSFNAKRDSYWGSGRIIKERIAQYGKQNFVKEILEEFDDRVEAHKKENEYIEKFRNDDKCLNQMLNRHFGSFSEETREKMGDARRGEKNPMYGKIVSDETRAKLGAAHRVENLSEKTRSKLSAAKLGEKNPMYGKHFSKEHRAKIGAANAISQRGKTLSKEHRAKLSASHLGKTLSEEHRAKLSAALRGKQFSEDHIAKLSAARRGKTLSEEHRSKIGAALRGKPHPHGKHWRKNPVTGKHEYYD